MSRKSGNRFSEKDMQQQRDLETAHEGIEQHAGKKNESGVAVGFEKRQAKIRIVDIEPDHLPGQMAGKGEQA
jgi:hypothetical protein